MEGGEKIHTVAVMLGPQNLQIMTVESAAAIFSRFGEVASLDLTQRNTTGLVLVSFFDLVSAITVLELFPTAHLVDQRRPWGGSQRQGAQNVPPKAASAPRLVTAATPKATFSAPRLFTWPRATAPQISERTGTSTCGATGSVSGSGAFLSGEWGASSSSDRAWGSGANVPLVPGSSKAASKAASAPKVQPTLASVLRPLPPPRPPTEDLQQSDVIPSQILSAEDKRTTVMLRSKPKLSDPTHLIRFIDLCQLSSRLRFFYMPYDKRRNRYCGFAFVNLRTAMDVLMLHMQLLQGRAAELGDWGLGEELTPELHLSYARLQGQEQLIQHFGGSSIMLEPDANKRPQFFDAIFSSQDNVAYATVPSPGTSLGSRASDPFDEGALRVLAGYGLPQEL